jgi:hypothetical protein
MITPDLEKNYWRFPLILLSSVLLMFFLPFTGIMHSLKFAIKQRLELRRQLQDRAEIENNRLSMSQESDN